MKSSFLRKLVPLALSCLAFLGSAALPAAPVTVHWLTLSDGQWPDSAGKVIAAFEAKNPDIKVVMDNYPFRQLFETIEVRMKAQSADIDLLSVDVPLVASYAVRGYLDSLDQYFSPAELSGTWVAASKNAGTYHDHLLAAPQNTSTQFMYVNLKLFQDAGVPAPACITAGKAVTAESVTALAEHDRWTWEQVVEAAKKLTKTGAHGQVWGMEFDQVSRLYQLQALGESSAAIW